ncbi:MAG: DUF4168 domain-containing protein [Symploca sp. SIO1A3]|nr:DUF4168 domain-containing protein [Symploca sp. SIO2C1]NER47369.1 DUF4168 domain-containing protein [Symploca sp. SIO1A3]
MLKQLLTGTTVLALLLGISLPGFTQSQENIVTSQLKQASDGDINPEELRKFANAFKLVQQLEQESIETMFEIVESEGFSRERFGEILQAQQNPEAQPNVDVSQEESDKFDNAIDKIAQNRQETIVNMQQAVVAEGLDVERYDQILSIVKDDEELQKQVLEMIEK